MPRLLLWMSAKIGKTEDENRSKLNKMCRFLCQEWRKQIFKIDLLIHVQYREIIITHLFILLYIIYIYMYFIKIKSDFMKFLLLYIHL
jgi:hypothetical protein